MTMPPDKRVPVVLPEEDLNILSDSERRTWQMFYMECLTADQIAERQGRSPNTVRQELSRGRKKLGLTTDDLGQDSPKARAALSLRRAAGALDDNDGLREARAAKAREMVAGGRLSEDRLATEVDARLALVLAHTDEAAIERLMPRELVGAARGFFEMRQLLAGQPTAILDTAGRRDLADQAKALLRVVKKRGMVVDAEFEEVG